MSKNLRSPEFTFTLTLKILQYYEPDIDTLPKIEAIKTVFLVKKIDTSLMYFRVIVLMHLPFKIKGPWHNPEAID